MMTNMFNIPFVRSGGPAHPCNRVLTVNGGSSSIKFALFEAGQPPTRWLAGTVERIGSPDTMLRATGGNRPEALRALPAVNFDGSAGGLLDWLDEVGELGGVVSVGHRIVHGGPDHADSALVTPGLLASLRAAVSLAPNHLPAGLGLIDAIARRLPGVPQVACFDTAFHWDLPPAARFLPIPRRYRDVGVRRYGFHGLSYSYLLEELERLAGADTARGRVVLAHLGSGASMAAVRGGRCVDTTMGLTPAGGLMMGTRTGDLDPGVLVHLARSEGLSPDQLEDLVTRQSGLLGVSETSGDMRDLLAQQATDPRAADAVEMFCYQARKWVGALAAALGGLDAVVFAGGIGQSAPEVRARVCDGLEFLGVRLDSAANAANAPVISAAGGAVEVRVMATDEEVMIARTVFRISGASPQT